MAGRKRKFDPRIPAHIDQGALPSGIYWDPSGNGRWYMYVETEGVRGKSTVARHTARLSELHAIVEAAAGVVRGSVAYVLDQFHASTEFAALAISTKRDYRICAAIAKAYPTRQGCPLGDLQVDKLRVPNIQSIVEAIAKGRPESRPGAGDAIVPTPAKANHVLRYLRRTFAWGIRHGACTTNPAQGVRQAKEVAAFKMPEPGTFAAVLAFARERGARPAHTAGSTAPYLPAVMELAYGLRLRGIEVATLTDAHALADGIRSNRRKGSRDNVTRWTPRLRAAWDELAALRKAALERSARPIPLRPEQRILLVSESGTPLVKSSLDSAWQRLMDAAVVAGVIPEDGGFSLHGLKHRGMTDSVDKRAGGHKTEAMRQRYDHEVPMVDAAGTAPFSGAFSGADKKGT